MTLQLGHVTHWRSILICYGRCELQSIFGVLIGPYLSMDMGFCVGIGSMSFRLNRNTDSNSSSAFSNLRVAASFKIESRGCLGLG